MLQIICKPLMYFEYNVMRPLFSGTKAFHLLYVVTDSIFYGFFGGIIGVLIGTFSNALSFWVFVLSGVVLGLLYLLLKELYFWFLRPSRKEFDAILKDLYRGSLVLYRAGRWNMHAYMLCKFVGSWELEVVYVYRQGWNRCYQPGSIVKGFDRKNLGLHR